MKYPKMTPEEMKEMALPLRVYEFVKSHPWPGGYVRTLRVAQALDADPAIVEGILHNLMDQKLIEKMLCLPLSPADFALQMEILQELFLLDKEAKHSKMGALMCYVLEKEGYGEGIKFYKEEDR